MGWNARTLSPLAANEVTNTAVKSVVSGTPPFVLSSIWMSGYGVAADASGNLFFTTGNSENRISTYNNPTNIEESAVKMQGDLSKVLDLFTPSNFFDLDAHDNDFGSGGVMLLPDQSGSIRHVAVAAGKDGRMLVLDRDSMGGLSTTDKPEHVDIGGCWCGPSYSKGADGVGRVVSSGGGTPMTWLVSTAHKPFLVAEASGTDHPPTDHDAGFFTTVSSNGVKANTAIIWAVAHPASGSNELMLVAYNGRASGKKLARLWSGPAGSWEAPNGNPNVVPTIINGKVYVAGFHHLPEIGPTGVITFHPGGTLAIFGLLHKTPSSLKVEQQVTHPSVFREPPSSGTSYWDVDRVFMGARWRSRSVTRERCARS